MARIAQATSGLAIGSELRYFPEVDSTNRLAAELAPGHWRSGTILLTDFQTGGRGRRGRRWIAPAGTSLLLSLFLDLGGLPAPPEAMMMAALAVADAVSEHTSLNCDLKWPNDVLVCGRKCCGVLAEYLGTEPGRLIIGIGINVNFDPQIAGLPRTATTLSAQTGHPVSREDLAIRLCKWLDLWYRSFTVSPDDVFVAWASRLDIVDRSVQVSDSDGSWSGVVTAVRRDGALTARRDDGVVRTLYAADVSVRTEGITPR